MGDSVQCFGPVLAEVSSLGKVLPQQSVGIFIAASLPRALGVTEVNFQPRIDLEPRVLCHLGPLIPSQCAAKLLWKMQDCPGDGITNSFGAMTGKRRTILDVGTFSVTDHARQM